MKNNVKVACLLIIISLLCTGCWDKKEFNKISFADVLAIDKTDDEYILTLQLNVPKNIKEGGGNAPLWIVSGKGRTILEAADDINNRTPREIYWGHLNVVLLGHSVLEDDITRVVDFFSRSNQLRRRNFVVSTEEEAYKVLQAKTDVAAINHDYIFGLITDQERHIKHSSVNFNDVMIGLFTPGLDLYLPKLELIDQQQMIGSDQSGDQSGKKQDDKQQQNDEKDKQQSKEKEQSGGEEKQEQSPEESAEGGKAKVSGSEQGKEENKSIAMQLSGGALVKNKQLVGWVDEDWVHGYSWLVGNIIKGSFVVESPFQKGDYYVVEAHNSDCKFSLKSKDPLTLKVKVTGNVNITELSHPLESAYKQNNKKSQQEMQKIQQAVNQTIKEQIEVSIKEARALNCDPFGFGRWIYAYHPTAMKDVDWDNYMKELQIEVEVDVKLKLALIVM